MACVAAPIIGGPRPLTQATTHPPKPSISHTYDTLKREEPQKVDVPDCDYRHILLPLSVRQGFGYLGWSVQGDRRETASMLVVGVRGAFCRQD